MVLGYRFLRPFGSKRQSRAIDSFLYCKGTKKINAKQEFWGFISDLFQMLKFSPLTIEQTCNYRVMDHVISHIIINEGRRGGAAARRRGIS